MIESIARATYRQDNATSIGLGYSKYILASRALGLGTMSSQTATIANSYLTAWEKHHTGQLFLSYVSGPVDGILMIVTIYIVAGIFGKFPPRSCFHAINPDSQAQLYGRTEFGP